MQKLADDVRKRAEKYPNCKHPHHRVRPLVQGFPMLWCSLCWEAWEPDPFAIPAGTITLPLGNTVTVTNSLGK